MISAPSAAVEVRQPISASTVHDVLGRHLLVDGLDIVLDPFESRGSWLVDALSGQRYLDMFSFYGSNALGMNHPALTTPEALTELGRVAVNKPPNSGVYTVQFAEFVQTFMDVVGDPQLPHLFFIEGGALAVENALKVAFDWKSRRNAAKGSSADLGTKVMHLTHAFHGRTGYTMSLTNSAPEKIARYPKFDWPRLPSPAIHHYPTLEALEKAEQRALQAAREAFRANPDDVAAFIVEPIQAEGGDNHLRPEFLRAMQSLCHEYEALFIVDEVQTGAGLTGTTWAYQQLGLEPDIVCFGKKFQVCGLMAGRRVDMEPDNVFHVSGRINSTWGGNLTDMVRATRILRVIDAEGLIDNAARRGADLLSFLLELQSRYPEVISSSRGRGLMCAFDLPDSTTRDRILSQIARDHHVLLLPCGPRSIRFRPTLTVTTEELRQACDAIAKVVSNPSN